MALERSEDRGGRAQEERRPMLRDFLANKGSSRRIDFPTPAEIAAHLTPGDAKALVQELIKRLRHANPIA